MCLSSTLPNQSQFELKKYHQVGCHERHILKTMKMEISQFLSYNFWENIKIQLRLWWDPCWYPHIDPDSWSADSFESQSKTFRLLFALIYQLRLNSHLVDAFGIPSQPIWKNRVSSNGFWIWKKIGIQTDWLAYCAILQIINSNVMQYTTIMTRPSSLNVTPWSITSLMPPYNAIIVVKKMTKQ